MRNKSIPVVKGYSQEEGIDYNKTFAPISKLEGIRIFLVFATHRNFIVYKVDVTSVFLNGELKKRCTYNSPQALNIQIIQTLYINSSKHFMDSSRHQGHGMILSLNFYIENGFTSGIVDKTLFHKKHNNDLILVQIHVDDIIFGYANYNLCKRFA